MFSLACWHHIILYWHVLCDFFFFFLRGAGAVRFFFQYFFNISGTAWNFDLKFSATEQNLFTHFLEKFWVHTIYGWWCKHFLSHVIRAKNNVYSASKNCYKTCSTHQMEMKLCKVLDIRLNYLPTNFMRSRDQLWILWTRPFRGGAVFEGFKP